MTFNFILFFACALVPGILAALRLSGVTSKPFQAAAHLYLGILIGCWIESGFHELVFLIPVAALIVIELFAFFFVARS